MPGVNDRLNPTNCRQHKRAITRIAPTPDQRRRVIEEEGNCSTNRQGRPIFEREWRQPGQSHGRLSPRQDLCSSSSGARTVTLRHPECLVFLNRRLHLEYVRQVFRSKHVAHKPARVHLAAV